MGMKPTFGSPPPRKTSKYRANRRYIGSQSAPTPLPSSTPLPQIPAPTPKQIAPVKHTFIDSAREVTLGCLLISVITGWPLIFAYYGITAITNNLVLQATAGPAIKVNQMDVILPNVSLVRLTPTPTPVPR